MAVAVSSEKTGRKTGGITIRPTMVLGLVVVALMGLLCLPIRVPVGAMYWDLMIYYDGANRIFDGQVPSVDFFMPVGALGYYLFALTDWVFPNANPTLLVHWTLLIITAPMMAVILRDITRRSVGLAWAVLVPFLIFAVLPFNTTEYYPFPGSDGFGIYNRQVCQLLYVLVATLMFVEGLRARVGLVAAAMLALFFTKITGFVAGGILCAFALVCGRVTIRQAAAVAAICVVMVAVLQIATGIPLAYVSDIDTLLSMNSGTLLPRILQSISRNFAVLSAGSLLVVLVVIADRARFSKRLATFRQSPSLQTATAILDHPALWLFAALIAGMIFETQNTGSQAMIFVWLPVIAIVMRAFGWMTRPRLLACILLAGAAAVLPFTVNTMERAARAYAGGLKNLPLETRNLKTLGHLNMRPEVAARADKMMALYPAQRAGFEAFAGIGELSSPLLYSDPDFQITHLRTIDDAIDAIGALERRSGVRFETMLDINFVNPFPYLMDRSAPRRVSIGADPSRTVPPMTDTATQAVSDVDLALLPTCPLTAANRDLLGHYAAALSNHRRITLTDCFDAFVNPRFGNVN